MMNTSLMLRFLLQSIVGCLLLFPSCKEKNEEYPPVVWNDFFFNAQHIAARPVSAILNENNHSVWLGSQGGEGLLHFDGYSWKVFDYETTGIDFDSITCITRDGNGLLWVGWKSGLAKYDGTSWTRIGQFNNRIVTSLSVAGLGSLWIGMKSGEFPGGLAYGLDNQWVFDPIPDFPSTEINALMLDFEQVLWIATQDLGIIKVKNSTWKKASEAIPLITQHGSALALSSDGSIWAAMLSQQLVHFDKSGFTLFNTGTSVQVTGIFSAENGNIWCSTSGAGLLKFDGKNWTSFNMGNARLPSNDVLTLAKGDSGFLLFSLKNGQVLSIKQ